MNIHEAVKQLDGSECGREGSPQLFTQMKKDGLVAVFGSSDDLMQFRGAIYDEVGATTAYLTSQGLLLNDCDSDRCPHFDRAKNRATTITALWCPEGRNVCWAYGTLIPHAKFNVMEDGEHYCEGIVFALSEVP